MVQRNKSGHTPSPASFADFARRAGVNRSSVTRLAAGKLAAAVLADGRIDVAHPSVAAWARSKGIKPPALIDTRHTRSDGAPTGPAIPVAAAPAPPTPGRKRRGIKASAPTGPGPQQPEG